MKNFINTLAGLGLNGLRDVISQLFEFFNVAIGCDEQCCTCMHATACCCD